MRADLARVAGLVSVERLKLLCSRSVNADLDESAVDSSFAVDLRQSIGLSESDGFSGMVFIVDGK